MSIRGKFILALAVLTVSGCLTFEALRPHEPMYKGAPLSYWLDEAFRDGSWTEEGEFEADQAIKAAGTNAIPILLQALQAKDSAIEDNLRLWLWRLKLVRVLKVSASAKHKEAEEGFAILSEQAKPTSPR